MGCKWLNNPAKRGFVAVLVYIEFKWQFMFDFNFFSYYEYNICIFNVYGKLNQLHNALWGLLYQLNLILLMNCARAKCQTNGWGQLLFKYNFSSNLCTVYNLHCQVGTQTRPRPNLIESDTKLFLRNCV